MIMPLPSRHWRLPPLFPEPWASGWGQDRFGLWQSFTVAGVTQVLRWIPPGGFLMGSPETELERLSGRELDETQHKVILSQGYWLADTACTQALWTAVMGENPSLFKGGEKPVENISWIEIVERFLPAMNATQPGLLAGLPTEAQWEYACRAGTKTPFWFGDNITSEQVNYNGNHPYQGAGKGLSRGETMEVKAMPCNGWGLYQMHGNVWEWCADWLGEYSCKDVVDPVGPPKGYGRVLRGGGWFSSGGRCRSARRVGVGEDNHEDDIGFRLARGIPPSGQARSEGLFCVATGAGLASAEWAV